MNFKIDENLPVAFLEVLSSAGHDAVTVGQEGLGGASDPRVSEACRAEKRILVTLDLDFADIRTYPPETHSGMLVFRVERQDRERLLRLLRDVLPMLSPAALRKRLWIVEDGRVRIRRE